MLSYQIFLAPASSKNSASAVENIFSPTAAGAIYKVFSARHKVVPRYKSLRKMHF